MSVKSDTDTTNDVRRVLLAKNNLYPSGNSISVSLPQHSLENTTFGPGDHISIFSNPEAPELVLTIDSARYHGLGWTNHGSRKIRRNTQGTLLVSVPQDALEDEFGYETSDEANGVEIRVTVGPLSRDLFVEFPERPASE